MKVGDKVLITDGSYAIKLSAHDWNNASINNSSRKGEEFTVVGLTYLHLMTEYTGEITHDIIIQSNKTKETYLHSSPFVKVVNTCPCCNRPL